MLLFAANVAAAVAASGGGGAGASAAVPLAVSAAKAAVDEGVIGPRDELGQILADFALTGAQGVAGRLVQK